RPGSDVQNHRPGRKPDGAHVGDNPAVQGSRENPGKQVVAPSVPGEAVHVGVVAGATGGYSHGISYSCIKQPFRFQSRRNSCAIQLSVPYSRTTSCVKDCNSQSGPAASWNHTDAPR